MWEDGGRPPPRLSDWERGAAIPTLPYLLPVLDYLGYQVHITPGPDEARRPTPTPWPASTPPPLPAPRPRLPRLPGAHHTRTRRGTPPHRHRMAGMSRCPRCHTTPLSRAIGRLAWWLRV